MFDDSAESKERLLTPRVSNPKGILAKSNPWKSTRVSDNNGWDSLSAPLQHPGSIYRPPQAPRIRWQASIFENKKNWTGILPILQLWGLLVDAGPRSKSTKLLVCPPLVEHFLLCNGNSSSTVDTTDGDTLWQQHDGQRRRVEVLRIVHRSTRAEPGKTAGKSIPMWPHKTPQLFSARRCLLLSSHVPMYEPGLMARVQSDVQVRSAFLTWRLFWLHRVDFCQRWEKFDGQQRIKREC